METVNLVLRYGFGVVALVEAGLIVRALVKLARDKAKLDAATPAPAEE